MSENNVRTIVEIKTLDHYHDLSLPAYATDYSAGIDLYAAIDQEIILNPSDIKLIPTGIAIALPQYYEAGIRPRSGLAAKHGITVLNSPGTIDADYRGEIKAILINHGSEPFIVHKGMRIAQMVVAKYEKVDFQKVDNLSQTARGEGGFGSTGI